jgi:hypothetical protein
MAEATLELGIEGSAAPFTAEGVVDDDGQVRVEDLATEAAWDIRIPSTSLTSSKAPARRARVKSSV